MRRHRARWWCVNGKTASWKSDTVAGDYVTRKSRRARPPNRRRQPSRGHGDGCQRDRRPATHGENVIRKCGHKGGTGNERRAVEMTERWKARKSKGQDFPSSHRFLEISQRTRDSHIPTAPATRPWKSGKPKTGFPLSHSHLLRVEQTKTADCVGEEKGTLLSR